MPQELSADPIAVTALELDPKNPRLPPELAGATQDQILEHFVSHYDLEELGWSFAANGYWEEEPLLTVDSDTAGNRVVVEGNRRLATLKLMTDGHARKVSGKASFWSELADLAADEGHDLTSVPTRNYANPEALLDFLGFRHVSGLMQWKADAKARYIYALITEHNYTFEKAARAIGSRPSTIRRNFVAWASIMQARSKGIDTEEASGHFGVYYRALQNPRIREFMRLDGWVEGDTPNPDPLEPETGPKRVGEFLGYVFGANRVIKESRQLDDLGLALDDPSSLEILRSERNLDLALRARPVDREGIIAELRLAYRHAATANAEAFRFPGHEDLQVAAKQLVDVATQVFAVLSSPKSPS